MRSRWLDIDQVLFLRVYGPRRGHESNCYFTLLCGRVPQGLGSAKFANMIG